MVIPNAVPNRIGITKTSHTVAFKGIIHKYCHPIMPEIDFI